MPEKINGAEKCSVCKGTGKPTHGSKCICGGIGTRDAEVEGLRGYAAGMRDTIGGIMGWLAERGYHCQNNPSWIVPQLERIHQRALDAEDSYVKFKKQVQEHAQ